MSWHVYELPPIDFRWGHLKTVEETAKELAQISALHRLDPFHEQHAEETPFEDFAEAWESAQDAAGYVKSEGRGKPVVFWVPKDDSFVYGFVMKLDNNGTTLVASPVELPHYSEYARD